MCRRYIWLQTQNLERRRVKQHVGGGGGGNFNSPAHLMHSILLLSISSMQRGLVTLTSSFPGLCVWWETGEVLSAEKEHRGRGSEKSSTLVKWGHLIFLAWKILWIEIWLSKENDNGIQRQTVWGRGCQSCEKRTGTGFAPWIYANLKGKDPFLRLLLSLPCTVDSASITHLAGIQSLASWIREAVCVLSCTRHNEHNILHRYGHVFVGRVLSIHSSIRSYRVWWLGGILQRAGAAVAGLRVWVWAAALFRAAGGRQIHRAHLRKGQTEKNGEQIASPSHYCCWLPQGAAQAVREENGLWLWTPHISVFQFKCPP